MTIDKPKRIRKTGDIGDLKRELWRGIVTVRAVLLTPEIGVADTLKAAACLAQLAGPYMRLVEQSDLQKEMEALRDELEGIKKGLSLRKVV